MVNSRGRCGSNRVCVQQARTLCGSYYAVVFPFVVPFVAQQAQVEGPCRAMSISIVSCPHCQAMVLSDAARCHVCDHVIDHEQPEQPPAPALPTDNAVAEDLETCASCGETYRTGLVRCWNCGAFTRNDIKEAFERMSADPERIAVREQLAPDMPEVTSRSGPWKIAAVSRDEYPAPAPVASSPSTDEFDASDDDFSFELADDIELKDAPVEAPVEVESEVIRLAAPAEDLPAPVIAESVASEAAAEAPVEIPALETSKRSTAPPADQVAHSEATAGDVLLKIAQEEEVDIAQTRKNYASKVRGGFIVFCPMGCRIRVQDRHRGKAGKCPKCGSVFFVPRTKPKPKAAEAAPENATPAVAAVEKWRGWMEDVHLHSVLPQKLRIKPDSLLKEFVEVDLVASAEGLLLLTLVAAPGFMGANLKKKPAIRIAAQEHLRTVGSRDGLQVAQQRWYSAESLAQLSVAQPAPADVESLFGNIPVFGTGRIAVRLPRQGDDPAIEYLSFSLAGFRQFAATLSSVCGVDGLGTNTEIPLKEAYNTVKCHYSESPVQELLGVEYYQKDPAFKLQITGWRCGGCGLVVSEDSRKKEKIGGLNGKGIAKAKCPKCAAKFGQHPMYAVEAPQVEAPVADGAAAVNG